MFPKPVVQYSDPVLPLLKPSILVSSPDRITEVKTNIYVTSFGPVSDTDMVRGHVGHVFSVFNYLLTALCSLFIQLLRPEKMLLLIHFSVIAAFLAFIIASSSLSPHAHDSGEVGRVFHTTALRPFIWQLSSDELLKASSCYSSHAFVYPGPSCLSFWSSCPPAPSHLIIPSVVEDPIFQVIELLMEQLWCWDSMWWPPKDM